MFNSSAKNNIAPNKYQKCNNKGIGIFKTSLHMSVL